MTEQKNNPGDFFYNRGLSFFKMGKVDEAINDFDRSIEHDPTKADVFYNRGTAYNFKGWWKQSLEDFTEAINLKEDFGDAYHNRAVARFFLRDLDGCIRDINKARSLGIEIKPELIEMVNKARG